MVLPVLQFAVYYITVWFSPRGVAAEILMVIQ